MLTDHGPTGGDEINAIFQNEIEKKINFGWPISTYGKISKNNYVVIKEQKYSNHEKHGFKEPIKYFSPSNLSPTSYFKGVFRNPIRSSLLSQIRNCQSFDLQLSKFIRCSHLTHI